VRYRALLFALLAATACSNSRPHGTACDPGTPRCNMNRYEVCAGDGATWLLGEDCSAEAMVCLQAIGCRVCDPNSLACGGDGFDIERCASDGSHYDPIARCEPVSGQLCAGGACKDACTLANETRSYEGCEYWAVDLDNAVTSDQGPAAAQQYSVVVSNPLEIPASVKVEVDDSLPGEAPLYRTVAQVELARVPGGGDLKVINLDAREVDCSSDPRLNDGTGTCLSRRAYHITSTAPIIAYQFNPLENVGVYSNDASLLLPQSALDGQYVVSGWPETLAITNDGNTNGGIDLRAFLTIVGTREATTVQLTLKNDIVPGSGISGHAGDIIDLAIGPYDVINLESDGFNSDFTGTGIFADKPIAVFSGSEASDVPYFTSFAFRDCCADHLEEQLFPESSLGRNFVGAHSPRRTKYLEEAGWNVAVLDEEPDWWRVVGTDEDTTVTTNLPPPDDSFMLGRGQIWTFSSTRDFVLTSNHPVAFSQFEGSQQTVGLPSTVPGGDPSFAMIPPIEQWRRKYVFLVPNKYVFDFLMIAMPVGTRLRYDGLPLADALPRCEYKSAGFLSNGSEMKEYVAIRCPLSMPDAADPTNPANQDDGRHTLESEDGEAFGLVVWGWDRFVSYAYPGGSNVDVINPL
jgi:hypothetical protein